ncbi:MAG TPA: DUF6345 domain-containing protein [Candidatus Dormibacteraeota bacterium]|nr:DUF6345 domain-containing protein [Candidatus Dormibacteraeota bacterium]
MAPIRGTPTVRFLGRLTLWAVSLAAATQAHSQSQPPLPVYLMTQTGAQPPQAATLASYLGIPAGMISVTNGQVTFLDPTNFVRVPAAPVTNSVVVSNLIVQTQNKFPSIPINIEQPDFDALNGLVAYSSNSAVSLSSNALASAGLTPQWGSPSVSHDIIVVQYTNNPGTVLSVSNVLDTEVDYQFTVPGGYPLIGPGAQVQFNYGTNGNVSRLLYAARQFTPGPTVAIIPSATASNRAAAFYPGLNPQLQLQLVYYAPSLSITSVTAIIPWYQVTGTGSITNPQAGGFSTIRLDPTLLPATDDPGYVPTVNLTANLSVDGTQVIASSRVTGGKVGYSYSWMGSALEAVTNKASHVTYTPSVRVNPPALLPVPQAGSPPKLVLTWYDPPQYFILESSSNLVSGNWSAVTNRASGSNGLMTVTVETVPAGTRFFRLRLLGPYLPQPETLTLAVHDGNGVVVKAQQSFSGALATVLPPPITSAISITPGWGFECPYDLGLQDMGDWNEAMNIPLFGVRRVGYWEYASAAYDYADCYDSWWYSSYSYKSPNDYDATVGKTDLLLHIGHGGPDGIGFTDPWYPIGLGYPGAIDAWGIKSDRCGFGNTSQEWMGLLSCEVLAVTNSSGIHVSQRWLPCFEGLHLLLGFVTDAYAETGFPKVFGRNMGGGGSPVSIYQAWFDAAKSCGTGSAGVLSALGPNGAWDIADYWWGEGKVGPTIRSSQIQGWSFIFEAK